MGGVPGYGENVCRLSARFPASIACSWLGIVPGSCVSKELLADSFWVEVGRPEAKLKRLSCHEKGPGRVGEGDSRKESVGKTKDSS